MTVDPARPPRFPYVGALLCAACLGAAGWTWMRCSYCWDITPREFYERIDTEGLPDCPVREGRGDEMGRYVSISGNATGYMMRLDPPPLSGSGLGPATLWSYVGLGGENTWQGPVFVRVPRAVDWPAVRGSRFSFRGRVIRVPAPLLLSAGRYPRYAIDSTASRFTGASIAGLVVGAMGVFIFTLALRDWVNRRRASSVHQAEGET